MKCLTLNVADGDNYSVQIDEEDGEFWRFPTLEAAREFIKEKRKQGWTLDFFIELYIESHRIV